MIKQQQQPVHQADNLAYRSTCWLMGKFGVWVGTYTMYLVCVGGAYYLFLSLELDLGG